MQENFDSCFCVRDSANTQISKLSGAWKESRTMLEGLTAPNAHLIPLKKEDTVCCFTLLPSIKKTHQPNGATFSSHGSRPCWMGFGWCGIQGRSSLIGLGESWDCSWGEAVGWIGAWPVAERGAHNFRPNGISNEWKGKSAAETRSVSRSCSLMLQQWKHKHANSEGTLLQCLYPYVS